MKRNTLHILERNTYDTAISTVAVDGNGGQPRRLTPKGIVSELFRGVDDSVGIELLSMLFLITTNSYHRDRVDALTNPRYRNIKALPLSVTREVMRQHGYNATATTEEDVENFESFLKGCLASAKEVLGLPGGCAAEFSYPVTTAVLNATDNDQARKYLEQTGNEGPVLSGRLGEVLKVLQQMDLDGYEAVESALLAGETRTHLSVMAIEGTGRDMAVAIVNPQGRMLRLSIRRFELLVENLNMTRSLGDYVREVQKGDYLQTYINTKIPKGEVLARYTSKTSTISVAVICARKGDVEDVADFILDADAIVCTYLAVKRLRQDFTRFIALRDEAGSRIDFDPFER